MSPRRLAGTNADLLLLLGVTLLVLALPTSGPLAHLEGFLGLMLALLAPGYLLAVALFPAHGSIDGLERFALSLGLSIVAVVLIVFGLSYTPGGITSPGLRTALASAVVLLGGVVYLIRRARPEERGFEPPRISPYLFAAIGTVFVVIILILALWGQRPRPVSTAFYILGSQHELNSYPILVRPGAVFTLTVGLQNHSGAAQSYSVQSPLLATRVAVPLVPAGGEWQETLSLRAPEPPGRYKVLLRLYRRGDSSPYRTVYFWVRIGNSSPLGAGRT